MKNNENLNVSGHLEIYKVYDDGNEELVFDEANTITSGMGVGLGLLYAGSGASDITNFQIRYFQLGVSGDSKLSDYGVSEVSLVSALGQVAGASDYQDSADSNIPLVYHHLMGWNGAQMNNSEGDPSFYFAEIPDNSIKRVDLNSVTYILYVDKNSCNSLGAPINEVGLFMKNPLGVSPMVSNLVAYRPFNNITKTNDFALVFKWTLNF